MLRPVPTRIVGCGVLLLALVGCQSWSQRVARNPFRSRDSGVENESAVAAKTGAAKSGKRSEGDVGRFTRYEDSTIRRELDGELTELPPAERAEIAADLETLDPATARMVMRTIKRARGTDTGGPTNGAFEGDRFARTGTSGIPGGSAGIRTASGTRVLGGNQPLGPAAETPRAAADRRAATGLGTASPWPSHHTPGNDSVQDAVVPRTALRPPSQFGSPDPTRADNAPEDHVDALARRLTREHPAAAANATPADLVAGDARNPNNLPFGQRARFSPDPSADETGTRPVAADETDLSDGETRTMSANFSTRMPGFENELPTAGAESPYVSAIRHLERTIEATRSAGDLAEVERRQLLEDEVFLRLLYLADGQEARAIVPIEGVPADEQEFWKNVLWALANYFDHEGIENPTDRTGQVLVQLRSAVRSLQARARLELRNVNLCSVVRSFGDYEPLEANDVRTGDRVIVYAEVENFRSTLTDANDFVTRLRPTIEFYREGNANTVVKTIDFAETIDYSRHHRRDYYLVFDFNLPTELTPGRYTMTIQLDDGPEDESGGRIATQTLKFEVTP